MFLRKTFQVKQKSTMKKHEMKFNKTLFKIQKIMGTKKEYPKHIEEKDVVTLCQTTNNILITPKADGVRGNLNIFDMNPKVSSIYFDENFDCEIVDLNGTKIHFIIGTIDTINQLINKHHYFPKEILL